LVSERYAVDHDVDFCDVAGYVEAEDVDVVKGFSDLFCVLQGWFCREVLHGREEQFVLSVVFGVCEFGASGAVYCVPYVRWSEAGFPNSLIPFDGVDNESPLSCMGGGGCRRCLLERGVNARPFGVVSFSGRCEPESVNVNACGRNGCPGLFDAVVGGGGGGGVVGGGYVDAAVVCRGDFQIVVGARWSFEDLDCVGAGVGVPLLLLLLGSGVVVAGVVSSSE